MTRKAGIFILVWMLFIMYFPTGIALGAGTPSFSVAITSSQVSVGDDVEVSIQGQNVSDLYGYEVMLTYDAERLEFVPEQTNGTFEGFKVVQSSGNQVKFAYTKIGKSAGENGNLHICSFIFEAKKSGAAQVNLQKITTVTSQLQSAVRDVNAQASIQITDSETASPPSEVAITYIPDNTELRIEGTKDGGTAVTAVIDRNRLSKKLQSLLTSEDIPVLHIVISGNYTLNAVQLPLDILYNSLQVNQKTMLTVESGLGRYNLPLSILNHSGITKDGNLDHGSLIIRMDKANKLQSDKFDISFSARGLERVSDIIDYKVILKSKDNEQEIHDFGKRYVSRVMNVGGGIMDASAATAVVYDPASGELRFIPSVFNVKNGKTEATVIRNTNSMYAIVQYKKTFDDIIGHWARQDVEALASKLIINGTTDLTYTPEMQVTRAQFAALLVRGLGLPTDKVTNVFADVMASQWYAPEINTAAHYGLVQGVGEGKFNPDQRITREQMVVMMMNAVQLVQGKKLTEGSLNNVGFEDQDQISDYARKSAAEAYNQGLIKGKTESTFAPQDVATRAEAAVVIKRALQYLGLIN